MTEADQVEVAIRLESRQDGERTVTEYRGRLFRKTKAVYLRYVETDEDEASSSVTVRYDGEELRILRQGKVDGEQSFVSGKRRQGSYTTPIGRLRLETETELLRMTGEPGGKLPLTLDWSYGLWIEEEWTGRFELRLHIKEVEPS